MTTDPDTAHAAAMGRIILAPARDVDPQLAAERALYGKWHQAAPDYKPRPRLRPHAPRSEPLTTQLSFTERSGRKGWVFASRELRGWECEQVFRNIASAGRLPLAHVRGMSHELLGCLSFRLEQQMAGRKRQWLKHLDAQKWGYADEC